MKKNLLNIILIFCLVSPALGTTYLSDHFDSQQTWTQTGSNPNYTPPPSPWHETSSDAGDVGISNTDDAHVGGGSTGKCLWVKLGAGGIDERWLEARAVSGLSEYYLGYWFKHSTPWSWASGTSRYKHIKYFADDDQSTTINLSDGGGSVMNFYWDWPGGTANTHVRAHHVNMWGDNDSAWHSYVIYVKHNTAGSANGAIRVWVDGTEANYSYPSREAVSNTAIKISDNRSTFSFGSFHQGFGYQKYNFTGTNYVYFDDVIFASTKEEVEAFLGVER